MVNVDKIITEVINNSVISKNLLMYSSRFEQYFIYLKRIVNNRNNPQDVNVFLNELYNFTESLIYALNRCASKGNLNEAFGSYGGWGISDLPILTGPYNAFMNGFRNDYIGNDIRTIIANNRRSNNNVNNNNVGNNNVNPNNNQQQGGQTNNPINTPTNTKLSILLSQYYPKIRRKYIALNRKYNNGLEKIYTRTPTYIIEDVDKLLQDLRNANNWK